MDSRQIDIAATGGAAAAPWLAGVLSGLDMSTLWPLIFSIVGVVVTQAVSLFRLAAASSLRRRAAEKRALAEGYEDRSDPEVAALRLRAATMEGAASALDGRRGDDV
jgi:hypothetical protein